VVPNHACVAVSTRRTLFAVEGDEVVGTWAVLAR
jgi:D-serine deaminase-like pyridoxal phosphate-dependent protein